LKENINQTLRTATNQSKLTILDTMMAEEQLEGLQMFHASGNGIILYFIDGFEGLTADEVTREMLDRTTYERTEFGNNERVEAGDPMYKLVTEEEWMIVFELNEETAEELEDTTLVRVRFARDNEEVWGRFEIVYREGVLFGHLTFDNSMIRYVQDRYLDFTLILEDESGLKIPRSARVEREFYVVSVEYITLSDDESEIGVLLQVEDEEEGLVTEFFGVNIYFRSVDRLYVYLSPQVFERSVRMVHPESGELVRAGERQALNGVFNINRGYTVFRRIYILSGNDEYYIIESGSQYGIFNFDRIALDGGNLEENQVVR